MSQYMECYILTVFDDQYMIKCFAGGSALTTCIAVFSSYDSINFCRIINCLICVIAIKCYFQD